MKKIILSTLFALSLASGAGFSSYAADHDCACDQGCTEKCEKGEHKDCTCDTCECGKGKSCKHGKCATKKHKKSGQKAGAVEAPKAEEAHAH